ncbi:lysylphosphatidylglycerol synthase transmembrane domain-containing protein [Bacillus sp. DJP31]|uniref:lysylphosphatidylglycerol synthase transmembrane domain-containing protein n=1 Tax=Bacillus sp. DJP31 TaxID=3409789 RepID=UPI003BB513DE
MKKIIKRFLGVCLIIIFLYLSVRYFERELIGQAVRELLQSPLTIFIIFSIYSLAFLLRALAWKLYLGNELSIHRSFFGLMYSLLVNHLLPIKVGDFVRIGLVTYRSELSIKRAAESVFVMRILDLLFLGLFSSLGLLLFLGILKKPLLFGIAILLGIVFVLFGTRILSNYPKIKTRILEITQLINGPKGSMIFVLVALSWILEGIVVFAVAGLLYEPVSYLKSIWVNSITVGGQVFQLTPGGLGTYEAVMSWALISLNTDASAAYTIALMTHATKFIYAYIFGFFVVILFPIPFQQLKKWIKEVKP